MKCHSSHGPTLPTGETSDSVVDRLTALIAEAEHGMAHAAPISPNIIRELTAIRDALK
jgi:hypothetical protein